MATSGSNTRQLHAPWLPTAAELLLLSAYPLTLIIGSLFSAISPDTRNAPYDAIRQSHPPSQAPSYFAKKSNFLNVGFVRVGWFWTSLAASCFIMLHSTTGPSGALVLTPRRLRGLLRIGLCTLWWLLITQWFLGPSLMDRVFTASGGFCEEKLNEDGSWGIDGKGSAVDILAGATCKLSGGIWQGGHDLSGHVFLLVLGSAMLWQEMLPLIMALLGAGERRTLLGKKGRERIRDAATLEQETIELGGTVKFGLLILVLCWFMLFNTAAYFHTWPEKVRLFPPPRVPSSFPSPTFSLFPPPSPTPPRPPP